MIANIDQVSNGLVNSLFLQKIKVIPGFFELNKAIKEIVQMFDQEIDKYQF